MSVRITVTPAGATSSLEACSWVELLLPFMPGETLGLLCWTGQRRRFGVASLPEGAALAARALWLLEMVAPAVVRLWGAMYTIISTLVDFPKFG
jgi:hypothetical protein